MQITVISLDTLTDILLGGCEIKERIADIPGVLIHRVMKGGKESLTIDTGNEDGYLLITAGETSAFPATL